MRTRLKATALVMTGFLRIALIWHQVADVKMGEAGKVAKGCSRKAITLSRWLSILLSILMYSAARSSCSLRRIWRFSVLVITSSAAVGVEFRHAVALRRPILCNLSILLKSDSLLDAHTA